MGHERWGCFPGRRAVDVCVYTDHYTLGLVTLQPSYARLIRNQCLS